MEAARLATPIDLPVVAALADEAAAAVAPVRGGSHYLASEALEDTSVAALEALLTEPTTQVWVGTIDDVIIGFVVARLVGRRDGNRIARIEALWVSPGARAVGVGELLLDAVLAWAGEHDCAGVDALALPGDRATKNLFESSGLVARAILVHKSLDDA